MLDNQLIELILSTINPQLVVAGIPGTPIAQGNQPTQQGVFKKPAAYLHKIGDHRIGWPEKVYQWDGAVERSTDHTAYQTMFQVSALATQDPSDVNQLTASDVLNLVTYCLQTDVTVSTLSAQGVGILQINNLDNPYFVDDRGRWEASPSMTFTVTHAQIINTTAPYTDLVHFTTLPVQ